MREEKFKRRAYEPTYHLSPAPQTAGNGYQNPSHASVGAAVTASGLGWVGLAGQGGPGGSNHSSDFLQALLLGAW